MKTFINEFKWFFKRHEDLQAIALVIGLFAISSVLHVLGVNKFEGMNFQEHILSIVEIFLLCAFATLVLGISSVIFKKINILFHKFIAEENEYWKGR